MTFNKGMVRHSGTTKRSSIVAHPLDDADVRSRGCPAMMAPQGFNDQKRLPQFDRPLDGMLQGEIEVAPPVRDHPVKNVLAVGKSFIVTGMYSLRRHGHLLSSQKLGARNT